MLMRSAAGRMPDWFLDGLQKEFAMSFRTVALRLAAASSLVAVFFGAARGNEESTPRLSALDASPLLVTNVHVVPVARDGVLRDHCVRIEDGRITAIAPGLTPREGERVVDGRGRHLVPGFADMHLHLPPDPGPEGDHDGKGAKRALHLLLAHGVTTVRGLAGHPAHPVLRDKVESGALLGPMLYVAGPALHVGSTKSPEQARSMVTAQRDAGFDLVKSHHLVDVAVYDAAQTAAREVGLPVAGHVATEIGLERAIAANQQIEHLDGFVAALIEDMTGLPPFGQFPPIEVLTRVDESRIAPLAERFAKARLPNTPTLALFEGICDVTTKTSDLAAREPMRYVSAKAREGWSKQRDGRLAGGFPDPEMGKRFVELRRKITAALGAAGAPLLVGSDCPQDFLVEGFATHSEMTALERAGLTPAQVLRAATLSAAEYLHALPNHGSAHGLAADFGAIEIGRRADLVLLRDDPLAATGNLASIDAVIVRGKLLDRTALDALLEQARAE
jgi:imidazolonepropionase-like amidohydrolase